jgi:tetratricopeptide (TPR) repeat protein
MNAPIRKNQSEPAARQTLWNYVLTIIVSAALGAGITWLIISQHSKSEFHPVPLSPPATAFNATPDVSGLSAGNAAVVLGNFAYDHQRWPDAIRQYQEAIASGVNTADVHTDLGNAFRFSGESEKALQQYEIAQKQNPQHENSLFNQGGLYAFSLNQPEKALEIWREYLARFPQSPNAPKTRQLISEVEAAQGDQRSEVARWLKNRTQPTPTPSVR